MSADNYYTVKLGEDLKWHVCMGFMSSLEDEVPAFVREGDPGCDSYREALRAALSEWSEYGVIEEPAPLNRIATGDQFREFLEEKIALYTSHLERLFEEAS